MKKIKLNKLGVLLLAIVFLAGCRGLEDMVNNADKINYEVDPSPLELHNGEIPTSINGRFPAEYFNKDVILEVTPFIEYEGQTKEMEPLTLQGQDVDANNKVISFDNGGSFSYEDTVAYEDGMKIAELKLDISASAGDQSMQVVEGKKIADGTIITPKRVKKGLMVDNEAAGYESGEAFPSVAKADVELAESTTDAYKSDIHYVIQRSRVRRSETRKDDVENMREGIQKANENEEKEFKNVDISSYASPDGPYEEINEPLSKDRGESAKEFIKEALQDEEISQATEDKLYNIEATAEDWEGFKKKVQNSSMDDKDAILRVLEMNDDPQKREQEIKKMAEAYNFLKKDILPELRRSKIAVNFEEKRKTDQELKDTVASDSADLTKTEFIYTASLYDNLDDKISVYDKMIEQYPDCWRAYNNKGCVLVHQNKQSAAKEMFEKANGISENEMTQNNLGAIAFMNENYEEAATYFDGASENGSSEAAYNRGVIHIMDGEYEEAVNTFGTSNTFNAALAQLLNGDNSDAMSTLNNVNSDNAWVDYLKAVVGARQDDLEAVTTNLQNAVEKNSDLAEEAQEDMEFGSYFEVDEFTSIVE